MARDPPTAPRPRPAYDYVQEGKSEPQGSADLECITSTRRVGTDMPSEALQGQELFESITGARGGGAVMVLAREVS